MNIQNINEATVFKGLPKHWITYLAYRYGKGHGYGYDYAGENSTITPLKKFDPNTIKKALKDATNIAVIGKKDGEPIFMIAPHDDKRNKFRIFEVTPGKGKFEAKGEQFYAGRRRRRSVTNDFFDMNQIIDIIDKMMQNQDFEDLTVEAISKDAERQELSLQRGTERQKVDPLQTNKPQWGDPIPSVAQKARAKKYGDLKKPVLDKKLVIEIDKIKTQMGATLDKALENVIADIKRGYSFNISKEEIGKKLVAGINISGLQQLVQAYDAIKTDYSQDQPYKMAQKLKNTGMA
jgi:predicted CoA-binding protein